MTTTTYEVGNRIVVRGVTGSGKSTLARALGYALGLRVIELDAINWQRPNWEPLPVEKFRSQLAAALAAARDGWIVEGNYSTIADLYLAEMDTLVWIHLPWRVSFWRLLRRSLVRMVRRDLLWGVQRESFRLTFFSRDSILWWSMKNHVPSSRRSRAMLRELSQVRAYELRSAAEVARFLQNVKRQAAAEVVEPVI